MFSGIKNLYHRCMANPVIKTLSRATKTLTVAVLSNYSINSAVAVTAIGIRTYMGLPALPIESDIILGVSVGAISIAVTSQFIRRFILATRAEEQNKTITYLHTQSELLHEQIENSSMLIAQIHDFHVNTLRYLAKLDAPQRQQLADNLRAFPQQFAEEFAKIEIPANFNDAEFYQRYKPSQWWGLLLINSLVKGSLSGLAASIAINLMTRIAADESLTDYLNNVLALTIASASGLIFGYFHFSDWSNEERQLDNGLGHLRSLLRDLNQGFGTLADQVQLYESERAEVDDLLKSGISLPTEIKLPKRRTLAELQSAGFFPHRVQTIEDNQFDEVVVSVETEHTPLVCMTPVKSYGGIQ